MEALQIKLGSGKKHSFYNADSGKEYTEIQEGKMPWNMLDLMIDRDENTSFVPFYKNSLGLALHEIQPELAIDEWGDSMAINLLIKDFEHAGLIDVKYSGNRQSTPQIIITDLGKEFFRKNTIIKED